MSGFQYLHLFKPVNKTYKTCVCMLFRCSSLTNSENQFLILSLSILIVVTSLRRKIEETWLVVSFSILCLNVDKYCSLAVSVIILMSFVILCDFLKTAVEDKHFWIVRTFSGQCWYFNSGGFTLITVLFTYCSLTKSCNNSANFAINLLSLLN